MASVTDKPPAHTPTPWETAPDNFAACGFFGSCRVVFGEKDTAYCPPTGNNNGNGNANANAAFIVRACNAHEDSVAACKKALKAGDPLADDRHGNRCATNIEESCDCWLGKIRAVLIQAEGGAA